MTRRNLAARLRPAPEVLALWDAQPSLRREYVIAEALALALGLSLIVGELFTVPTATRSFDVMLQLGTLSQWGVLLLSGAAILFVAARVSIVACHWALRVGAGVYALIAVSFGLASWPPAVGPWWATLVFAGALSVGHLSDAADYRPPEPPPEAGQ